jgi:hypothetical protein
MMHASIVEALSGYLHGNSTAEDLMDWVTSNLGQILPCCDSRATVLLGHVFAALAEFDEGACSEHALRSHLMRLYLTDTNAIHTTWGIGTEALMN